ncbi:MAG TPA: sensor histidine kinase, partial [Clostridia bacterium]|nr:sensor histidine kinase [Clostridia bacterium]
NSEGEIVATSSNDLLKKYSVKNISFNNSTNNLSNWIDYRFTHENALIGYHVLENTNWCMVTIIPLGNIELESKHMKNLISIFVLVISACSYVIAYIISRSITKGISELANKMHDLHNGRLEPINISSRKDEIGMLIEDYNYMTVRMTELIKEQYRSGQMLKTSELKALQSQINPHFLYNTLDMINWFARSNKGEEITSVVESLSQFYKISLSGGKNIISIKDELEHVSNYFQIQNMRFNNNLKLNISIPEEMLDCGILKITLQPIVENAILHGILCKESKTGTVKISGYQIDGDIIIAIKDDGIGMSECSLNKIIRGEIISQKGSSFGLKNIHERIELHFGIGYGLSFKSNLGRGTTVEIRIAMEKL